MPCLVVPHPFMLLPLQTFIKEWLTHFMNSLCITLIYEHIVIWIFVIISCYIAWSSIYWWSTVFGYLWDWICPSLEHTFGRSKTNNIPLGPIVKHNAKRKISNSQFHHDVFFWFVASIEVSNTLSMFLHPLIMQLMTFSAERCIMHI